MFNDRSMLALTLVALTAICACSKPPEAEAQADKKAAKGEMMIFLWPNGAPGAKGDENYDKPTLQPFLPEKAKRNGSAVVICPGGGYGGLATGHEGVDIAEWLNSNGICAFILRYRHAKRYQHPIPMLDVQRAIRVVRSHASEIDVDPKRIGVIGFSAGGHLASTAGTHFDKGDPKAADPIDKLSCRPDFLILCYPVISFTEPCTHKGSRNNLLGHKPNKELWESLSNEKQVTAETPPTFLMHTTEDPGVPAENSILFYLALKKAGVPAELHIYEKGRHGLGLAPKMPALSTWPDQCINWLRGRGMLGEAKKKE